MPVLKNRKEELVAQGLAKGMTQVEAYAAAGFEPNDSHASRYVVTNGRIGERVKELQQTAAEKARVTIGWWVKELRNIHKMAIAQSKPDFGAANSALDKLGKHIGAYEAHNKQQTNEVKVPEELRVFLSEKGVDVE